MYKSDIYEISNTINQLKKKHIKDVSEDTLQMGMYGYLSEIFSNSIQNSIIMASEWGNEAFPIRSKFEKTILTNAITYNVENINAIPAKMTVMIGFIKKDLEKNMVNNIFKLDKDCKIMIEDFEFHLDYDLIITKDKILDNIYSVRYDINRINKLSDLINPYSLQPPIILNVNNDEFVFVTCDIRQIKNKKIYKKIISDNILENKSFDFHFDNQLASFDVIVEDNEKTIYLTPIFEGMPLKNNEKYCYYNYLDKNTIRVKFDRLSYEPKMNCNITINLKNTQGSDGNFDYRDDIITTLKSEKIEYNNLSMLIKPISSSTNGINRKSMKELKEIIPKEILSRGNITNNKDLENFFDIDDNNKLFFYRRRDNQFERLFYAYMLVKDENNNIVPTNTIDIQIKESDFNTMEDDRYILNPGNIIKYDGGNFGYLYNNINKNKIYEEENKNFIYSFPYTIVVNKSPLSVSYYLNQINREYQFKFSYINNATMQFIPTPLTCYRNYIEGKNYKLTLSLVQTMNVDKNLISYDAEGDILKSNIIPLLVLNINEYKYYIKGNITHFYKSMYKYDVEFILETDNIINKENQIKLNNIYIANSEIKSHIYVNNNIDMSIFILAKFNKDECIKPNLGQAESIVPNLKGYTLCNIYNTLKPVNLFYNYSNIIKSKIKVNKNDNEYLFNIKSVPVVRYSYINNIYRCNDFIDYIQYRKAYIDSALDVLENSFNVDLKFFNTYGISKTFKIGYDGKLLNKVNLTLNFKLKLYTGSDKKIKNYVIKEIKSYIENINNKNINNLHMSNLITYISNKFKKDIIFIEFTGFNRYDSTYQYIEKDEKDIINQVPEFLNINLSKDLKPDINITLV